jgi:hypothetical protein
MSSVVFHSDTLRPHAYHRASLCTFDLTAKTEAVAITLPSRKPGKISRECTPAEIAVVGGAYGEEVDLDP